MMMALPPLSILLYFCILNLELIELIIVTALYATVLWKPF